LAGPAAREKVHAELRAAFDQALLLDHTQRFQADGGRKRIAPEGGSVAAGVEHVHQCLVGEKSRYRQQSAAQSLAEDEAVGPDAFVLVGEHAPGAPEPRLDLVEDEQQPVPIAPLAIVVVRPWKLSFATRISARPRSTPLTR
jgi:hypothetical protein